MEFSNDEVEFEDETGLSLLVSWQFQIKQQQQPKTGRQRTREARGTDNNVAKSFWQFKDLVSNLHLIDT